MPAKPIKHGIKLCVLCRAETGHVCSFETHTGEGSGLSNSPTEVVKRLLDPGKDAQGRRVGQKVDVEKGRTMHTDNWRTSLDPVKTLGEDCQTKLVGTVKLTSKKSRGGRDLPFGKLSSGAAANLPRGWCRRAVANVGDLFLELPPWAAHWWVQMVIKKDRKIFGALGSDKVGARTTKCRRWSKPSKKYMFIDSVEVVDDHCGGMGGVDRLDRDVADWGTSTKSHCPHSRIFDWCIDADSSNQCRVATHHEPKERAEPLRKHNVKTANCRCKSQMDKALEVIRLGIERDWDRSGGNGNEKPAWMRQVNEVACGCQTCCFCTSGDTTGIAHPSTQKKNSKAALSSGHAVSPKHDCTKFDKVERQGDCSLCHLSKKLKFDTADEGASRKKTVGQQEQGGSSVQGVQQADVRRLR